MSYWFQYGVAVGHDNIPGIQNIEVWFITPLRGTRIPLGTAMQKTLDKREHWQGSRPVSLHQDGCTFDELEAYVLDMFGDWNTENADVTLEWRERDNNFSYWNAVAHLPVEGEDYEHETTQLLRNITLRFDIISPAT